MFASCFEIEEDHVQGNVIHLSQWAVICVK